MTGFDVTVSGLDELEAAFGRIQRDTMPVVDKVVAKGAVNIKGDARKRIFGHPHIPAYPFSISYDTFHTEFASQAQIGPDKTKRQGPLGNLLEYGSVNNAPIPHLHPALDAEAPRFERALADAAAEMWDEP